MKRRVVIRDAAETEIDQIARYLAQQGSLSIGLRFYDAVDKACRLLARMPRLGKQRITVDPSLAGLRSWSVKGFGNYLIFYLPLKDGVEILHVIHGSRDLPQVIGVE